MKKRSIICFVAAVLALQGCGKKIEYRVDGPTPQEQYSVVMKQTTLLELLFSGGQNWQFGEVRSGNPIYEFTTPKCDKTQIAKGLIIGRVGSDGMSVCDIWYRFVPSNNVMQYKVTYDVPTVADFGILLRDLVLYGGVKEEVTEVDAYQLTVVDTALFESMKDTDFQRTGSDGIRSEGTRWCYTSLGDETERGFPVDMYCFMSALRNWYGIPVFMCEGMNWSSIALFADETFYTQEDNFDAVNKMIRERYGLEMVPADRKMTVKTYSADE